LAPVLVLDRLGGRLAVTVVEAERVVHRPPDVVFDFVATRHFENHPRWDPDLVEMRQTSAGPVAPGTTAQVIRGRGRRRVEGTATVTAYEPCRRAAWCVRFGAFALQQAVDLSPEHGGAATRLRLSIEARAEGPIRLLLPLLRGRFRRAMTRSLATIESLLERGT
jgi:hypothetical protein